MNCYKLTLLIVIFLFPLLGYSHNGVIQGEVKDPSTHLPLVGATVQLEGVMKKSTFTDQFGTFKFTSLHQGNYRVTISYIGFEKIILNAEVNDNKTTSIKTSLLPAELKLSEVTISSGKNQNNLNSLGALDLKLRPGNSSQDLLRIIPGLFIAQHAGGGKAEQIFLRGFDIDHGTDINLSVDGMPVNMVSHAHGQGYSDLHFVIPEIVHSIDFAKGPYDTRKGNFATAGYAAFNTAKNVDNLIKVEGGLFGTFRNVNQFNLLTKRAREKRQEAYVASEFVRSDGYFESPQDFKRLNLFGKYHTYFSDNTIFTASLSHFKSKWNASGQIPERAISSKMISRFGSLDPTEGGNTDRQSINLQLTSNLPFGTFNQQAYFINYNFKLYSNFTFFLNDSINGDQIKQKEGRKIYGYQSDFVKSFQLGEVEISTQTGVGLRLDKIHDIELSNTINRTFIGHKQMGDVTEVNSNAYFDATVQLSTKFSINSGIRYDHFVFEYKDELNTGVNKRSQVRGVVSPKLNFNYMANENTSVFLKTGTGFHSNDSRTVMSQSINSEILPKAYGADFGTVFRPTKNLLVNTALWYLYLQNELVYVGDEGIVESSGRTRRFGVDFSSRYQFNKWLFFDLDLNLSQPRAIGEEGSVYIPLAPTFTSTSGLTVKTLKGWSGSVRYRYIADRPANENNTVTAQGCFLLDATIKYSRSNYEIGLQAENILNQSWKEAQFDTESRLRGETQSVSEIHFTPGAPFFVKAGVTVFIR